MKEKSERRRNDFYKHTFTHKNDLRDTKLHRNFISRVEICVNNGNNQKPCINEIV